MSLYLPLPLELVLNVIACSVPTAPDVLLHRTHPVTKLLLSFTLVCHETRNVANSCLLQHCLVLDCESHLRSFLVAIPQRANLRNITSLSLSPFGNDIDNLPVCSWVQELFCYTCDTLKKLVIDMPLRTCYPENDRLAVRPVLRRGFERLVNLEEFTSTRDELYLDVTDMEGAVIWTHWPRLRRLALYNVAADQVFWKHVARHPSLETLVLANTDCLFEADPKTEYLRYTTRPLRVVLCTQYQTGSVIPEYVEADWSKIDAEDRMKLSAVFVTGLKDDSSRELQIVIKRDAEDSTLWSWWGEDLLEPSQLTVFA